MIGHAVRSIVDNPWNNVVRHNVGYDPCFGICFWYMYSSFFCLIQVLPFLACVIVQYSALQHMGTA